MLIYVIKNSNKKGWQRGNVHGCNRLWHRSEECGSHSDTFPTPRYVPRPLDTHRWLRRSCPLRPSRLRPRRIVLTYRSFPFPNRQMECEWNLQNVNNTHGRNNWNYFLRRNEFAPKPRQIYLQCANDQNADRWAYAPFSFFHNKQGQMK